MNPVSRLTLVSKLILELVVGYLEGGYGVGSRSLLGADRAGPVVAHQMQLRQHVHELPIQRDLPEHLDVLQFAVLLHQHHFFDHFHIHLNNLSEIDV